MKKTMIFRDEKGFTLIEIIAVLVIMGILAAVAVPKFFDLQSKAKIKAVETAFAELKTRVNQRFAEALLDGATKGDTIDYTAPTVGTNVGSDFSVTGWSVGASSVDVDIQYNKPDGTPEDEKYNQIIDFPTYF